MVKKKTRRVFRNQIRKSLRKRKRKRKSRKSRSLKGGEGALKCLKLSGFNGTCNDKLNGIYNDMNGEYWEINEKVHGKPQYICWAPIKLKDGGSEYKRLYWETRDAWIDIFNRKGSNVQGAWLLTQSPPSKKKKILYCTEKIITSNKDYNFKELHGNPLLGMGLHGIPLPYNVHIQLCDENKKYKIYI